MRTGIYGDIIGSSTEQLFLHVLESGFPSKDRTEIKEIIQEEKYIEPVMDRILKIYPEDLFAQFINNKRRYSFTDDTVMAIASMDTLLKCEVPFVTEASELHTLFAENYKLWAKKYPEAGYSKEFTAWYQGASIKSYLGVGNGAAMRTAPFGYASFNYDIVMHLSRSAAESTHSPEGVRAALTVTEAIFIAHEDKGSKDDIIEMIRHRYFYNLQKSLADIRPGHKFESLAQNSVPAAITAFLESHDHLSAVDNALSLGGDTDTQAMIAGCIADAFYGRDTIPQIVLDTVEKALPKEMLVVLDKFEQQFII